MAAEGDMTGSDDVERLVEVTCVRSAGDEYVGEGLASKIVGLIYVEETRVSP